MKLFALSAALLAAGLAATSAQAQTEGTLAKIKASHTLIIGSRDTSLPFSYRIGNDKDPIGYTNDICLKIAEAVKRKLELPELAVKYVTLTSTNRIPLIQNGTADLDCATTTNTKARAEQVDFAPSHFAATITVATRKDSGIRSMADLSGKTVATVAGSTSIQLLREYRRNEKADVREISGKDPSEAFLIMTSGRADAYVLDDVQLASMIATSPNPDDFVILQESLREEPYGIMFRKNDPEFKALVDQTVAGLMTSGEIGAIYDKWFLSPVPPKGVNLNFPMTPAVKALYASPNNTGI